MADVIDLGIIRTALSPSLASALFDELAGASDLLDKGHDPILVAKLLITALEELVKVSTE
jgi:hypothetical protein